MTTPVSDSPDQIRQRQERSWSRSAHGWAGRRATFEAGARVVSHRLADAVGLTPGLNLDLADLACGAGEPTLTLARRLGPLGTLVGLDLAHGMIVEARRAAVQERVEDRVRFEIGDLEALPLADGSQDAATCRWGLMFAVDPSLALREVVRILKPGGRFAASVWDHARHVPMIALARDAAQATLNAPAPTPDAPEPFRLADRDSLRARFLDAGFEPDSINVEEQMVTWEFLDAEEYCAFHLEVSAALADLYHQRPYEAQAAFRQVMSESAHRFADPHGIVRMPCRALIWQARTRE